MRWLACLLLAVNVAHAAPQVEIKAQTQLALQHVRMRDSGMVEVTGQLVDKLTGEGIASQRVYVTIAGQKTWVVTAPDGSFKATLPGEPGPQPVELAFDGGAHVDRAPPLTVTTDPAKTHVELAITKLGDEAKGARLRITALDDEGAAPVTIALELASTGKDDWKPLRSVPANSELMLTRAEAGGPGLHRVRASFTGDDNRQAARTEVTVELTSSTTTSMTPATHKLPYEDDLAITGKVADDDGRPVKSAAVTLMSGDRRLAQGVTSDDGTYKFKVEGEILAGADATGSNATASDRREHAIGIQVQADPGLTYVKPSHSQPEVITIAAPQPVPVSYTIAGFIATVIAAGAFFAARSKPWQRLRRPARPADVDSPDDAESAQATSGGLVTAKPSIVSTLRRPTDDTFSGVVRDTVRGRPVADATVHLVLGEHDLVTATGADGAFSFEGLAAGEWRAEVGAEGHISERFAVTIPHRGELRGVRVDLVPVRERVFQLYRRAAEPVLPEARLWGIWSPRQIVDHVRSKRPSPALADLTDFVEEVYFSPRVQGETILETASERVDRAIHERARR